MSSDLSWRKCRQIFQQACHWHQKKGKTLSLKTLGELEALLSELEEALTQQEKSKAAELASKMNSLMQSHFKKSPFDYFKEILFALTLALSLAVVIRQSVFEFYEIPTGSMRPTYCEKDRLLVSKTALGLNIPLLTEHLYFNPEAISHGCVVVWSGDQIDMEDTDSTFFGLPYKKRYIKRVIGKPGDTLYFYGGQVFGRNQEGAPIHAFQELRKEGIETIPFNHFEGRVKQSRQLMELHYMNRPLARLSPHSHREIYTGSNWIQEKWQKKDLNALPLKPQLLADFWGIGHYGLVRLIPSELLPPSLQLASETHLYLEIRHHPNVGIQEPLLYKDSRQNYTPLLQPFTSYIPLTAEHLLHLKNALYTSRFIVKEGLAARYAIEGQTPGNIPLPQIPDGCYELQDGIAYSIGFGGLREKLPSSHPLYSEDPALIATLFNLGVKWHQAYQPSRWNQNVFPERYAYFNQGDLYVMGHPIFMKNDPVLLDYLQSERQRYEQASPSKPYLPFIDLAPPLAADAGIEPTFLNAFGLKVPHKHYLVLGDNHANSLDGRYFGFLPEDNIQGVPVIRFWPIGEKWGFLPNIKEALTPSKTTAIIWGTLLLFTFSYLAYSKKRPSWRPLYPKP